MRASRTIRTVIWLTCFAAAFVTTHLPAPQHAKPLINDKLLHFAGFLLLSLLSVWRMATPGTPIPKRVVLLYFLGLALYAMLDETTQPLFNRDCEFLDWVADCSGAVAGMLLGLWTHRGTLAPKNTA